MLFGLSVRMHIVTSDCPEGSEGLGLECLLRRQMSELQAGMQLSLGKWSLQLRTGGEMRWVHTRWLQVFHVWLQPISCCCEVEPHGNVILSEKYPRKMVCFQVACGSGWQLGSAGIWWCGMWGWGPHMRAEWSSELSKCATLFLAQENLTFHVCGPQMTSSLKKFFKSSAAEHLRSKNVNTTVGPKKPALYVWVACSQLPEHLN